jgi:predicted nucleic acid-binding protein
MKIYLDTCCYNRPFDDLSQLAVREEAAAKRHIQYLVKYGVLQLVHSYVLADEIDKNPYNYKKEEIKDFLKSASEFVSTKDNEEVVNISLPIIETGVKPVDALHVACALLVSSDFFITTDKRILKYKTDKICITDPITFIEKLR